MPFRVNTFQDGTLYNNVLSITNNSNYRFSKIVIAKGFGILQIEDKESGVWICLRQPPQDLR